MSFYCVDYQVFNCHGYLCWDIESGSPCALAYVDIDMYKVSVRRW